MKKKYGKGPHILRFISSPPLNPRDKNWNGFWYSPEKKHRKWKLIVPSMPVRLGNHRFYASDYFLRALDYRRKKYGR